MTCPEACAPIYVSPSSIWIGSAGRLAAATSVLAHSWMNCDVLMQAPVEALDPIGDKNAVNDRIETQLDAMS